MRVTRATLVKLAELIGKEYVIDAAYGGYKLCRLVNNSGGLSDVSAGYIPARELCNILHSIINYKLNEERKSC